MGIEGHLYNLEKEGMEHETAFRCANCGYYESMTTDLGLLQPYCHRRERAIGWNPEKFYCTEYAAGDGLDEWEARIFPQEHRAPWPETVPVPLGRIRQTSLDQWGAVE